MFPGVMPPKSGENGTNEGLSIKWLEVINSFANTDKLDRDTEFIDHTGLQSKQYQAATTPNLTANGAEEGYKRMIMDE